MSSRTFFWAASLLLFSWITQAQDAVLKEAQIRFEYVYKGTKGTLGDFKSTSNIDLERPEASVFAGSVATETLDTNNGLRNWSLKSRKYFNVKGYPRISFRSTEVKADGNQWVVDGLLTIKGIEKPLQFTFTRSGDRLLGKAELYSSDFDITIKKKREDNLVRIELEFQIQ